MSTFKTTFNYLGALFQNELSAKQYTFALFMETSTLKCFAVGYEEFGHKKKK